MDITKEMYLLAKKVVEVYENKHQPKPPVLQARFLEKKPEYLHVIITLKRWYQIYEQKDGKVLLYLDNDHSHWIPEECLEIK